jgi:glycosyltransferase involved in cell wall biosynthesis
VQTPPTVSIVTATYNRADTLGRAIDSVLRQTYPDWELIVVDDGSTDRTSEVLSGYTDERIRVFKHERNRGVTAAKNTGLDHMQGD